MRKGMGLGLGVRSRYAVFIRVICYTLYDMGGLGRSSLSSPVVYSSAPLQAASRGEMVLVASVTGAQSYWT